MKSRCPKCAEEGKDTSGNGLHTYPDGTHYCFKGHGRITSNVEVEPVSELSVSQVLTYNIGADPIRNISEATAKKYGVRMSVDTTTGKPDTVYYPRYEGEELVGYKVKGLPKDFRRRNVGKMADGLWGKQTHNPKNNYLIITEGEEDAMAVSEMMPMTAGVDVMSLPNGINGSIESDMDLIDKYNRVYLCLDNDAEGKKGVKRFGDWLATITETRIIELEPEIGKDASDYLQAGKQSEFKTCLRGAKQYEPEGIVNGVDIPLSDLLTPMPEGYPIPFTGLQEKLHGIRKGEIITVCAGSGIGKSTLVREIALSLIEQGLSIANIALEDRMDVAAQALMALDMNTPLPLFRVHPPSEADAQASYDKVVANNKTFFYKHFAGITADSLMNKLYYYARSKKVDFIVLDHLSMVISSSKSSNERKDIDMLMTQLAKMVVETGVGLIQIVHLRRTSGDKSFAHGGEVELTDLRGSAALEQLSWAVVGLERDQQGDDRDFSKARVLKNRTWGFTGLADNLKFEPSTGRMFSVILDDGETEDDEPEA